MSAFEFAQSLTDAQLEHEFPYIPWRKPITVTVPGLGEGIGCRLCIGRFGLRGAHVNGLPQTLEEWNEHMEMMHS